MGRTALFFGLNKGRNVTSKVETLEGNKDLQGRQWAMGGCEHQVQAGEKTPNIG